METSKESNNTTGATCGFYFYMMFMISFGKFCDEKFAEDVLTKAVKINKI
jgi:hypothetical protein